ncbi:MAG: hypothetical protein LBH59_00750 [Planctomycetaceae bacterium]|nr:hypothetical protein [Planctomycetaceae bacterium]
MRFYNSILIIPKPIWAAGFALEQTLHVVAIPVFSYSRCYACRVQQCGFSSSFSILF